MEDKKEKDNKKGYQFGKNKKSGHKKLKSSGQLLPKVHNFQFVPTELPESFFEEIISTEIDLSEEFSMEKIYHLIKLYSDAIGFYMENDPSQVRYYKGRMELLLTNRDTLMKLKKESQNVDKNKKENNNTNNNNIIPNSDKKDLNLSINNSKNLSKSELKKSIEIRTENLEFNDINKQVDKVMGDYNINNSQNKKGIDIIKEDLNKQDEKWKEKLKNKKKNMLRNSHNLRMKHQRGISLDMMKSLSSEVIGNVNINEDKEKDIGDIDINKLDKLKNIFNQDIFEEIKEVKEENEAEGSDNKKNKIIIDDSDINQDIEIKDDSKDINIAKEIKFDDKDNKNEKLIEKLEINEQEKEVDIDDKIMTSVNEKMNLLMKLIDDIENNKLTKDEEEDNINENNTSGIGDSLDDLSKINSDIGKVPLKFQSTYFEVEQLIYQYISKFNNFFFKNIFEQFASNLKEIYDNKYKKYIDVSLEYHHQIKENEHLLEKHADYSEEKKAEIQQIIDSLKDEQQNQIAKIEDEFNRLIVSKVNEFKIDSFKNNSGILLIEEKLKLEIYSLINESFYRN
mgnify:CR=1 FL=1